MTAAAAAAMTSDGREVVATSVAEAISQLTLGKSQFVFVIGRDFTLSSTTTTDFATLRDTNPQYTRLKGSNLVKKDPNKWWSEFWLPNIVQNHSDGTDQATRTSPPFLLLKYLKELNPNNVWFVVEDEMHEMYLPLESVSSLHGSLQTFKCTSKSCLPAAESTVIPLRDQSTSPPLCLKCKKSMMATFAQYSLVSQTTQFHPEALSWIEDADYVMFLTNTLSSATASVYNALAVGYQNKKNSAKMCFVTPKGLFDTVTQISNDDTRSLMEQHLLNVNIPRPLDWPANPTQFLLLLAQSCHQIKSNESSNNIPALPIHRVDAETVVDDEFIPSDTDENELHMHRVAMMLNLQAKKSSKSKASSKRKSKPKSKELKRGRKTKTDKPSTQEHGRLRDLVEAIEIIIEDDTTAEAKASKGKSKLKRTTATGSKTNSKYSSRKRPKRGSAADILAHLK